MLNSFSIKGKIFIVLRDENNDVKEQREIHNLITNGMDAHVADALSDGGETVIGFMAIGTGLAASAARVALDSTLQGTAGDDNDVSYVATFPPGTGTGTISEAGLMRDDDNASLMTYSDLFVPIVKGILDTLTLTWVIIFGAS